MQTMILDIRGHAAELENGLSDFLRPLPMTRGLSVLIPQRTHSPKDTGVGLTIENRVISAIDRTYPEAFAVSVRGFPRGVQLVNTMVRAKLAQISCWNRHNAEALAVRISEALRVDVEIDNDLLTYIDEHLTVLYDQLHAFVGGDAWAVVTHHVEHSDLVLVKGEDFRAMCWELEHGRRFRSRVGRL